MSDSKGFYEILGIKPGSSIEECRKAYRRKQRIYHPDFGTKKKEINNIEDEALREEKLRELTEISSKLNEAKNTLDDEEKKKRYDMGMDENMNMGGGFGSDIFDFFKGFGRGRREGYKKVEDTIFKMNVTLKESFLGKKTKFKVRRKTICKGCEGAGGENAKSCDGCGGRGKVEARTRRGMFITVEERMCNECKGEKSIIKGPKCKECKGEKYKQEEKILELEINSGINNGEKIVHTGMGDESIGCMPGDLIFYIIIKEDINFKRIKDDLISNVNIDLYTALAGGKVYFTHIDGRILGINIPRITDLDKMLVIKREGMAKRGDLYLKPKFIINEKIDLNKLKEVLPPILKAEKSEDEFVGAEFGDMPENEVEEEEEQRFGFSFFG